VKTEPIITVGIMDRQSAVSGRLQGAFMAEGSGPVRGPFSAKAIAGTIALFDEADQQVAHAPVIRLSATGDSTFTLFGVTIGSRFHWERAEDQTFQGNLIFHVRENDTMAVINEVPLETYLESVVSSEMSARAPVEFLKSHAILSRSWLLAGLQRGKKAKEAAPGAMNAGDGGELVRWYDREEHDLFHVCADDHCQRYQGITKITSGEAGEAVRETRGMAITHEGEVCDARYSKACGGLTEEFATAWENRRVPYLVSIADTPVPYGPVSSEEEAGRWVRSRPEAFCNTDERAILTQILPDVDRETQGFFRWTVEYSRGELEEILREKSGLDFGTLMEIVPLGRGPSGRIFRLRISGSKRSVVVGKELEIRRWLSRTHLYSSAFVVDVKYEAHGKAQAFVFHGAGWGHGVGLCQIGAAVMATGGFRAGQILAHYFQGVEMTKLY
jgi:SpoIID/LytB domain protein